MIIILEKEKISEEVKTKLPAKGLPLLALPDNEIIFNMLKPDCHARRKK